MPMTFAQVSPLMRKVETWFISLPRVAVEGDNGPNMRNILHWEQNAVWVYGDYLDAGGLRASEYDDDGQCLLKVPASEIKAVYTEHEATQAELCFEADKRLLGYAC